MQYVKLKNSKQLKRHKDENTERMTNRHIYRKSMTEGQEDRQTKERKDGNKERNQETKTQKQMDRNMELQEYRLTEKQKERKKERKKV